MNEQFGLLGMSLFFTLSGFLITTTLYSDSNTIRFAIRRVCRIIPLAYAYIVVVLFTAELVP